MLSFDGGGKEEEVVTLLQPVDPLWNAKPLGYVESVWGGVVSTFTELGVVSRIYRTVLSLDDGGLCKCVLFWLRQKTRVLS